MRNKYRTADFDTYQLKALLTTAFKEIRKKGFFARQNFWCCQTCACAALPEGTKKYLFYHNQDNESLMEGRTFHLAYGETVEDAQLIVNILNKNGIATEWDGSIHTRIAITGIIPKPVEFKELGADI